MAAYIYDSLETEPVVMAHPGQIGPLDCWGFGTFGAANHQATLADAWRMVQRAGLARVADRATGRVETDRMGTVSWVEFALRPGVSIPTDKVRLAGDF